MMRFLPLLLGKDTWREEEALPVARGKFERILELARGKDILDIGCVGGERSADFSQTTHARLAEVARSCVGIDVVADEIARMRTKGYDAIAANAETMHLGRTFDLIVAADVIEHLANPGQFLMAAREHLRPEGLLCIVTPNALKLNNVLKGLAGYRVGVNPEHTCWYDLTTLRQLLVRYGFVPVEERWQDYRSHPLSVIVLRFRPNLAAHLIIIARMEPGGLGP